eukprot:490931-Karenia_brevis.AAC.1
MQPSRMRVRGFQKLCQRIEELGMAGDWPELPRDAYVATEDTHALPSEERGLGMQLEALAGLLAREH